MEGKLMAGLWNRNDIHISAFVRRVAQREYFHLAAFVVHNQRIRDGVAELSHQRVYGHHRVSRNFQVPTW